MKRFKVFSAAGIALVGLLVSACKGPGQVAAPKSNIVQEVYQEVDKCVKMAMAKPETRTWGEAYDYRISFATSYAEGQARAQMRRKISAAIASATGEDGAGYEKSASSGNEGQSVRDEGRKKNNYVDQVANGIVNNMAVIETSQYLRNDGSYHIYVCLEYRDGISKMSENIAKNVEQQVSDDERMKMNFEFNKFRERIENELRKQK